MTGVVSSLSEQIEDDKHGHVKRLNELQTSTSLKLEALELQCESNKIGIKQTSSQCEAGTVSAREAVEAL